MSSIASVNIAFAALVTQFALCLIILFAVLILVDNKRMIVSWAILFIITLGTLIFSNDLFSLGRALFGNASLEGFHASTALYLNFILTIIFLGVFIFATGGTTSSPLSPILYTITPLAIFLREPSLHILNYLWLILMASFIGFCAPNERWIYSDMEYSEREAKKRKSYILSASLCLLLTTYIGWVTRPR